MAFGLASFQVMAHADWLLREKRALWVANTLFSGPVSFGGKISELILMYVFMGKVEQ